MPTDKLREDLSVPYGQAWPGWSVVTEMRSVPTTLERPAPVTVELAGVGEEGATDGHSGRQG
jgi:hypothetical protein